MMEKVEIEISEYSKRIIDGYHLSLEERDYLTTLSTIDKGESRDYRFHFEELRNGLKITSLSWVGVIELESIRIIIKPKFNNSFKSLIDMICFVEQIPFYEWKDTRAIKGKNNFEELLIRLFITELNKLLNTGIVKDYVDEEDNLRQMKGRPDFVKNMQVNLSRPTRIFCRYDELVTNIDENKVLRSALEVASRFNLQKSTLQKLNRFRSEFEALCETYTKEELPVFKYHRLNLHYELAHRISYYILKKTFVKNIYSFKQDSFFSILIDMNELFEKFVYTVLKKYLPKHLQVKSSVRIYDAITVYSKNYRVIIPDIVIIDKQNNSALVIDAKYKHYGIKKVETGDIYQLAFYAQYFHIDKDTQCGSIIVYPSYEGKVSIKRERIQFLNNTIHRGWLDKKEVSIESVLSKIVENKQEDLQEMALELIR